MKSSNNKYVLIVEDDITLAKLLKNKLAHEGIDSNIVITGEQALEALNQRKPDVILLDLILPGKDGFSTLSEIKQNINLKNIPIIVLSNLGQAEDIRRAKELGVVEYIVKANFTIQDLVDKIKSYI